MASGDILVKSGKLFRKGSGSNVALVLSNSYYPMSDCDCCLSDCPSSLCPKRSWSIRVNTTYYNVCSESVSHSFWGSMHISAYPAMPDDFDWDKIPCKRNGERISGPSDLIVGSSLSYGESFSATNKWKYPCSVQMLYGGGFSQKITTGCGGDYYIKGEAGSTYAYIEGNCCATGQVGFTCGHSSCSARVRAFMSFGGGTINVGSGTTLVINGTKYGKGSYGAPNSYLSFQVL